MSSTLPVKFTRLSWLDALIDYYGEQGMEFFKKFGKQAALAGGVGAIVFFIWPGATMLFFSGIAVGVIVGNLYEPLESAVERLIDKF